MNVVPYERFLPFFFSTSYVRPLTRLLILLSLLLITAYSKAQLVINEVSQGSTGGSAEYIELLVTGTPSCNSIPCVDIRGWYIDDNNGYYATGSGTGIADGCVRFSQSSQWSCVKIGSLIVVYNDLDKNNTIPTDDPYDSNNDCVYIIPVSSSLFERNELNPNFNSTTYPTSGFTSGGLWSTIAMANTGDSFQVLDPNKLSSGDFTVSWNSNTNNTMIYFGIDATGMVMYMTNASTNDPTQQSNWVSASASTDETPGQANNADNAAWIESMNNSCQAFTPLVVNLNSTDASCNMNDGTVATSVSGGIPPYSYVWSNGETTSSIAGLSAGNYSLTVTDNVGCVDYASVSVGSLSSPYVSIIGTNATCGNNNGSASASVSGGNSPYTYSWSNGASTSSATSLAAGNYTLTVTDDNGCTATASVTIGNGNGPSVTTSSIDATCGNSNGSASATAMGGSSPYTYSWSNGASTSTATNLAAGNYTLTVTDDNGCMATASVTIGNGNGPSVTLSSTDATCGNNNGSASATVSGGSSPYTYSWSNGASTSSATSLAAGNYTLTVTDDNGCTATASVTIGNGNGPSVTTSSIDAICGNSNGSASATVSGGSSPYTYSWSNGASTSSTTSLAAGNYTLTVTDDNGCTATASVTIGIGNGPSVTLNSTDATCGNNNGSANASVSGGNSPYTYNWSNGASTSSASSLAAGNYTLTVTDNNGCTATASVTIGNGNGPSVALSSTDATCGNSNGSASSLVSGGTSPYSYSWSNGAISTSISNVTAGNYTLTVTDNNGCMDTVTAFINNIGGPTANIVSKDATCGNSNGSASCNVSGGTSPYTYSWSNGASTSSVTSLAAGNYTLTVTDNSGCSYNASVVVADKDAPVITLSYTPDTCSKSVGTSSVLASGGSGSYSYVWDNNLAQSTTTIINLLSGWYSVMVDDGNCQVVDSVYVDMITGPDISLEATEEHCNLSDATATVVAIGGSGMYSYLWNTSPLQATSTAINLPAGTYSVTVDDGNCSTTDSIEIIASPKLVSSSFVFEQQNTNSELNTTVYFYNQSNNAQSVYWDFGDGYSSSLTEPNHTYTDTGTYTIMLIATDENGCIDTMYSAVTIDAEYTFYIPNTFSPNGDTKNDSFSGIGKGISMYEMVIVDRWGRIIYKTDDLAKPWNGEVSGSSTLAQDGVYIYKIHVTTILRKKHYYTGHINLIR